MYILMNQSMCTNKCIASILISTNTCEHFSQSLAILTKRIKSNKDIYIQKFYDDLHTNNICRCDVGVFYVEKFIFTTFHKYLFISENENRNLFINNKMILYSWLEPKHLDITFADETPIIELYNELDFLRQIDEVISVFRTIKECKLPTEFLHIFLTTLNNIYKVIGQGSSHDTLFPVLVYVLIKSQVKDIAVVLEFLIKYRKGIYNPCGLNCPHLTHLRPEELCDCYNTLSYDEKEIGYYLILLQAGIAFIERIEYNNINITKTEFDTNIMLNIGKIEMRKEFPISKTNGRKYDKLFKYLNKFLQ